MFATYGLQDFFKEAEQQFLFYQNQIGRFDKVVADQNKKQESFKARRSSAMRDLGRTVTPVVSADAVRSLANKANSYDLTRVFEETERELVTLRKRVQEIENNESYKQRTSMLDPLHGTLTTELTEAQSLYNTAFQRFSELDSQPRMRELVSRRYGTNDYPHKGFFRFFNPVFLRDWKQADLICEKFNAQSFTDILYQYREVQDQSAVFGEQVRDLEQRKHALENLIAEHSQATGILADANALFYSRIGETLFQSLKNRNFDSAEVIDASFPGSASLIKAIDGMDHQTDYLASLAQKVEEDKAKIVEKQKTLVLEYKRYKDDPYRFRNKRWSQEQFDRKFNRDESKYDRSVNRYERTSETIYVYNDYSAASLVGDFLWWDLMTDGRLDGNFIPEVHSFYQANPGYSYQSSESWSGDNS